MNKIKNLLQFNIFRAFLVIVAVIIFIIGFNHIMKASIRVSVNSLFDNYETKLSMVDTGADIADEKELLAVLMNVRNAFARDYEEFSTVLVNYQETRIPFPLIYSEYASGVIKTHKYSWIDNQKELRKAKYYEVLDNYQFESQSRREIFRDIFVFFEGKDSEVENLIQRLYKAELFLEEMKNYQNAFGDCFTDKAIVLFLDIYREEIEALCVDFLKDPPSWTYDEECDMAKAILNHYGLSYKYSVLIKNNDELMSSMKEEFYKKYPYLIDQPGDNQSGNSYHSSGSVNDKITWEELEDYVGDYDNADDFADDYGDYFDNYGDAEDFWEDMY